MSSDIPFLQRPSAVASTVVLLHVGALWALQSGLLERTLEQVIPAEIISRIIEPPKPEIPKPELQKPEPQAQAKPLLKQTQPPPPLPVAINDSTPAPNAPVVVATAPAPLPPITAPVATNPAPVAAPPAPPPTAPAAKVELPRSDTDYLNNPSPAYPPVSRRMGEQGRVLLRVRVTEEGTVEKVELRTTSGSERLDAAAMATVQRWRFKPGTRGGVAEAMWVNIPIDFKLD